MSFSCHWHPYGYHLQVFTLLSVVCVNHDITKRSYCNIYIIMSANFWGPKEEWLHVPKSAFWCNQNTSSTCGDLHYSKLFIHWKTTLLLNIMQSLIKYDSVNRDSLEKYAAQNKGNTESSQYNTKSVQLQAYQSNHLGSWVIVIQFQLLWCKGDTRCNGEEKQDNPQKGDGSVSGDHRLMLSPYPSWLILYLALVSARDLVTTDSMKRYLNLGIRKRTPELAGRPLAPRSLLRWGQVHTEHMWQAWKSLEMALWTECCL